MKRTIGKIIIIVCTSLIGLPSFAQNVKSTSDTTTIECDEFIEVINSTLHDYYLQFSSTKKQKDSIKAAFGYDEKFVPQFSDSEYCNRLTVLDAQSPFEFVCNPTTLSVIKFFNQSRRGFVSVVLGRSKLYFPMFEEKLAKHDMPLELKYLAVIESGLRPQVKSKAGALGLWQFMYRTGKMYGMDESTYIDERMDPKMATEAACLYLKKLYELYGDWSMALAAYNAGPGNVNKAIKRSGGEMTYWGVRPYLPKETQGYVPNFIAMAYMMTYSAEHNISEREPKFHDFQIDTVCIKRGIHMETIDSLIGWKVEDIQALNPIYKTTYIPYSEKHACINIPSTFINKWIEIEDSIFKIDSLIYQKVIEEKILEAEASQPTYITHVVTAGQTLGHIAGKYKTTVQKIMEWNKLRSTNIAIGQRLIIYTSAPPVKKPAQTTPTPVTPKVTETPTNEIAVQDSISNTPENNVVENQDTVSTESKTHKVVAGDTLWGIANKNGLTVDELLQLNPGMDRNGLKTGQIIRVK
ncbi:MAG: LysM peptidoglycan-binding domain-containing protein [Brumimicrobium sp.]|nr:LysM peptidoglycan-binding domain-containing protein [Brumimicrobium sp.]